MSPHNIARTISAVILLASLASIPINFSILTNLSAYDNPAGILMGLSTVPVWLIIVGASLLVADRKMGYFVLYAGTALSLLGNFFSFVPFLPHVFASPLHNFVATKLLNVVVILVIARCHYLEARRASISSLV